MAKKKRVLSEEQRNAEINKLENALSDFYYSEDGLGCIDAPNSKPSFDQMAFRFYNEKGESQHDSGELFDEFEEGKTVVAYQFGETVPFQIKYENGKLSIGKNLSNLGPKPDAPGFLNRFLSFFGNKKARAICDAYDQYIADEQVAKTFNGSSMMNTRELNIEKEQKLKRSANAEKNHVKQKNDIITEIKKAEKDKTIDGFESPNRWERVGIDIFCTEVAKLFKKADPNISDLEIQDLEDPTFDMKNELKDLGRKLVQNAISGGHAEIFEMMVGKIVRGKTTDLEEKKLEEYFRLGHVDPFYRHSDQYKDVDFGKVANPNNPEGLSIFKAKANEMFQAEDPNFKFKLTDTKAMLALASHKFNTLNTESNSKDDSLGKIGAELMEYQQVYNRIASSDSESVSLEKKELLSIAHVHLIKQSLKNQTEKGENILRLFTDDVYSSSSDINLHHKQTRAGINVIDHNIDTHYFNGILNSKGIKADSPVNRNYLAEFVNDEKNYKLVAQGLLKGLSQTTNDLMIDTKTLSTIKEEISTDMKIESKQNIGPGVFNLKKITEENFIQAFNLKLAKGQEKFVSHPVRSLAQAYVYRDQCQPFGIYNDDEIELVLQLKGE